MENKNPLTHNFFAEEAPPAQTPINEIMGKIGRWMLHIIKVALLCYTAYHGIHAASLYADSPVALTFQILGFIVIDLAMLGIYIAYLNKALTGKSEQVAAFIVYTVCLAIAAAAVVIDSQIAISGIDSLSGWARSYFDYVLPIAPLIAGIGAAIIHVVDEDNRAQQNQHQQHRAKERELVDAQHRAQMLSAFGELEKHKAVQNMQLGSQLYVAHQLNELVKSPKIIRELQAQSLRDLPALLQSVGIELGAFVLQNGLRQDMRGNEADSGELIIVNHDNDTTKPKLVDASVVTEQQQRKWTKADLLEHWGVSNAQVQGLIKTHHFTDAHEAYQLLNNRGKRAGYPLPDITEENFVEVFAGFLAETGD